MTSQEIRAKFLDFFAKRGHVIVPSSSLIPDDPSVLFTTAGMQQFKRYYTGELDAVKDFKKKNAVSVQKCFRTSDIDEVGDESHLTFFEMLGNFSFGGYFKEKAIEYAYEFITEKLKLPIDYVSVFAGDKEVPADTESERIWESLGVKNVKKAGRADNFWGPTGSEGPCGPTSEVYVRGVEVWNLVFNEYYCKTRINADETRIDAEGKKILTPLKIKGIDTGLGLERLAMVVQGKPTIFETDTFEPLLKLLPETMPVRTKRILADHVRGVAFLISDGVRPSNKEAGYVLRRLMRRTMVYLHLAGNPVKPVHLFEEVFENCERFYPELNREVVLEVFDEEHQRFQAALQKGLRELARAPTLDVRSAFMLYESFGLPYEIVKELGGDKAKDLKREDFDEEFKKHQEISRAGVEKKFGGHGLVLDTGEIKAGSEEELKKVTRYHTATHLLHQALREVFGEEIAQRGSDITTERTRFDFTFPRKVTPEELKRVEDIVNEKIREDLPVQFEEMPKEEAEKTGALHFFSAKGGSASGGKWKYPTRVKVYYVGHSLEGAWNKEFCGGPHVGHTGEIGQFKIMKEEASSAGVRRIRATIV